MQIDKMSKLQNNTFKITDQYFTHFTAIAGNVGSTQRVSAYVGFQGCLPDLSWQASLLVMIIQVRSKFNENWAVQAHSSVCSYMLL